MHQEKGELQGFVKHRNLVLSHKC